MRSHISRQWPLDMSVAGPGTASARTGAVDFLSVSAADGTAALGTRCLPNSSTLNEDKKTCVDKPPAEAGGGALEACGLARSVAAVPLCSASIAAAIACCTAVVHNASVNVDKFAHSHDCKFWGQPGQQAKVVEIIGSSMYKKGSMDHVTLGQEAPRLCRAQNTNESPGSRACSSESRAGKTTLKRKIKSPR